MKNTFYFLLVLAIYSCTPHEHDAATEETTTTTTIADTATWIVENAVAAHGGEQLQDSEINFVFRKRSYQATRDGSGFVYFRNYVGKDGSKIADKLTNDTFTRMVNGEPAKLSPKDSSGYANSLNSVMYFAFLPYFLQDEAVHLSYEGRTTIKDVPYYELGVSFSEEGGGKDFEDEYVYWFRADNFQLDYLAYNFLVNGGGARFRQAYNSREVNGIRVQDYVNYKPSQDEREVLRFDDIFNAGGMDTLSLIELEEVR